MMPKSITRVLFGLGAAGAAWTLFFGTIILLYTSTRPNVLIGFASWSYVVLVVPFFILAISKSSRMIIPLWLLSLIAFAIDLAAKLDSFLLPLWIIGIPTLTQIGRVVREQSAKGAPTY